jgi:hypothetical protein
VAIGLHVKHTLTSRIHAASEVRRQTFTSSDQTADFSLHRPPLNGPCRFVHSYRSQRSAQRCPMALTCREGLALHLLINHKRKQRRFSLYLIPSDIETTRPNHVHAPNHPETELADDVCNHHAVVQGFSRLEMRPHLVTFPLVAVRTASLGPAADLSQQVRVGLIMVIHILQSCRRRHIAQQSSTWTTGMSQSRSLLG